MAHKGETTKLGYLIFYPIGMSTTNRRPTGHQVSESIISHRGEPSSDPSQKPTVSLDIPTPEESFKRLTCTPRLGESQITRVPKRLTQPDISAANIDES